MIAVVVLAVAGVGLGTLGAARLLRARTRWRRVMRRPAGAPGSPASPMRGSAAGSAADRTLAQSIGPAPGPAPGPSPGLSLGRWLGPTLGPALRPASAALLGRVGALALRPWSALVVAGIAAAVGGFVGGGVAAGVLAAYAAAGAVLLRRRHSARQFARDRVAAVDSVSTLAAELRAGLPAPVALAAADSEWGGAPGAGAVAVAARLRSAVTLAELTGAPLADVLDRLDSHLRGMDRARRTAEAQAAGARVSAALLAVLPIAGVGLGFVVGVDPARVLLHTALGAGCLGGAVVLQLAGLAWADRISRVEVPA